MFFSFYFGNCPYTWSSSSSVPTPFASHAFHPLDGFAQSFPYHTFIFIFPMQRHLYLISFILVNCWSIFVSCNSFAQTSETRHWWYSMYRYMTPIWLQDTRWRGSSTVRRTTPYTIYISHATTDSTSLLPIVLVGHIGIPTVHWIQCWT